MWRHNHFPEVQVGCNAWVSHIDTTILGKDAETFSPEPWLQRPEYVGEMEKYLITFDAEIEPVLERTPRLCYTPI
jgi:hypothetical protein